MVPHFTGNTRITGKTDEIPERPKEIKETLMGALIYFNSTFLSRTRYNNKNLIKTHQCN